MKRPTWIKATSKNSLSMSLSFVIALAPTISYAADAPAAPVAPAAAASAPPPPQPITRSAREWALMGTAATQRRNFEIAMFYLEKGDKVNAKKYLMNGVSASVLQGLVNTNVSQQLSGTTTKNPNWFDSGMKSSSILDAINGAPQLPPTDKGGTLAPAVTDFPGIFTTPNLPTLQATNPMANPMSGVSSSDEQVKKLTDLMNTNPELRSLLWQTAQQRLGATAGEIFVNPAAYTPGTQSVPGAALCNPYQVKALCSLVTGGGVLNADFSYIMGEKKNKHYGVPIDELADAVIRAQTYIAVAVGFTFTTLKNLPAAKGPVNGTWIGQTTVDITPSLALYYANIMMMGELAGIYNYPLNIGNKEALALVLLSLTRVVAPLIYHGKKNITPATMARIVAAHPIVNGVTAVVNFARRHNMSLDKALGEYSRRNPRGGGDALKAGIQISSIAGLPGVMVEPSERGAKADLAVPEGIASNLPRNANGGQPGLAEPAPAEPAATDLPKDPKKNKSRAAQIALIVGGAVLNTTYNLAEVTLAAQIMKYMFKSSYMEERRIESAKFRKFLLSSASTKFLKLLILSQSPDSLKLKDVSSTPVTPVGLPGGPIVWPGTTGTAGNVPVPAAVPGSAPAPNANGAQKTGPTAPPVQPSKTDPNGEDFPFALVSEQTQKKTGRFGGTPALFINNLARSMHICSDQQVDQAAAAIAPVTELIKGIPQLSVYNDWDEAPKAKTGLVPEIYKAVANLIPFYKNPKFQENLYESLKADLLKEEDLKNILLLHDCYGRPDTDRHADLLKEMLSFSNFSDGDIAVLRMADPFIRLRMGELIIQLIYLNGRPSEKTIEYFEKVKKILGLDSTAYNAYYWFYQSELVKAMYVPYVLSPTGYRLRNLAAQNPYDITLMDESRPDEPQALNPVTRSAPNTNGAGNWGTGGIGNDPFGQQPGGGGNGFPFSFWN